MSGEDFPDEPGVMEVHAELAGFENRSYALTTRLLDARTLVQIFPTDARRQSEVSVTCENRSPKAREDGVAWRC